MHSIGLNILLGGYHMNFFKNEIIDFDKFDNTFQILLNDEQINEKYIKGDVRIVTEQARYPLNTVVGMVESSNYHLNPQFQRRHRWDIIKKSRLIESFIMNVPIPPIFLYEIKFSVYEVMDGLQRVTAIYEFYKNKYRLQGLEQWSAINGRSYDELPEQIQKGIDRRYLSSIILLQETAKSKVEEEQMKKLVFERLNSGGVKLEPQETRNALYDGPLNQLCITLARNPLFCKMWGIPENIPESISEISQETSDSDSDNESLKFENSYGTDLYRKMEDVELVLRFFAYRQIDKCERIPLRDFLDYFLKEGNYFNSDLISNYEFLFNKTIELVYDVFGETAFYIWRKRSGNKWNWFNRPTKIAYDPLMQVFSQNLDNSKKIIKNKDKIRSQLPKFYQNNYKEFEGRNNNRPYTQRRIKLMQTFLENCIGD